MIEQIRSRRLPTHAEPGLEELARHFGFPCLLNPQDLRKYQPSLETWLGNKATANKNSVKTARDL